MCFLFIFELHNRPKRTEHFRLQVPGVTWSASKFCLKVGIVHLFIAVYQVPCALCGFSNPAPRQEFWRAYWVTASQMARCRTHIKHWIRVDKNFVQGTASASIKNLLISSDFFSSKSLLLFFLDLRQRCRYGIFHNLDGGMGRWTLRRNMNLEYGAIDPEGWEAITNQLARALCYILYLASDLRML